MPRGGQDRVIKPSEGLDFSAQSNNAPTMKSFGWEPHHAGVRLMKLSVLPSSQVIIDSKGSEMTRIAICIVALVLVAVTVRAADKQSGALAALEGKLQGTWDGNGPCDGWLILRADGTSERRRYGPAGINCAGTWTLSWNAIPPTLTFNCKTSDEPQHVGRELRLKLIQLDEATLAYRYESNHEVVFARDTK